MLTFFAILDGWIRTSERESLIQLPTITTIRDGIVLSVQIVRSAGCIVCALYMKTIIKAHSSFNYVLEKYSPQHGSNDDDCAEDVSGIVNVDSSYS